MPVEASGTTAAPASTAAPLLRVVTAGGGTTIPRAVLDASADRALADYEAGLRARLDAVLADRINLEGAALMELGGEYDRDHVRRLAAMAADTYASDDPSRRAADAHRGDGARPRLRLVPQPGPVQPATPCPQWCVVKHEDASDRFHYAQSRRFVGFFACLDLDGDTLTLEIGTGGAEGDKLGLAEVDELIAGLTRARAELADALAAYRQPIVAGGAA